MFENFPYTDMHQLNLDWIIKIAKDFLDQYTSIQTVITDGLQSINTTLADSITEIDTEAARLEGLLNQWYETHSQDIANSLATALTNLNNAVNTALASFNTSAEQKAQETLESIPADYTELANNYLYLKTTLTQQVSEITGTLFDQNFIEGFYLTNDGSFVEDAGFNISDYIPVSANTGYRFYYGTNSTKVKFIGYNNAGQVIQHADGVNTSEFRVITTSANVTKIRISYPAEYTARIQQGENIIWIATKVDKFADIIETGNVYIYPTVEGIKYGYTNAAGEYTPTPSSPAYTADPIPVAEGDIVSITGSRIRMVAAYLNGTVQPSKGTNTIADQYVVPSGVNSVILSIINAGSLESATYIFSNTKILKHDYTHLKMDDTFTSSTLPAEARATGLKFKKIESTLANLTGKQEAYSFRGNLNASASLDTELSYALKYGYTFGMYAEFSGSLDSITFQFDAYSPNLITITGSEIIVKSRYATDIHITHNMTLSNNVQIFLDMDNPLTAKLVLASNGVMNTYTFGLNITSYETFQIVNGQKALNNMVFTMGCTVIDHDVWVLGDSYLGMVSDNRWPYYAYENGYTHNTLYCGSTGAGSDDAMRWINSLLTLRTPKTIVWCFGMNYPVDSSSAPSAQWVTDIEYIKQLCTENNIELILTTTPSVPSRNNEQKCAYVRSSGYRYIDFAKAVGAQADGTWYTGMLASDNVHPTTKGAIALYNAAITAVPELAYD